MASYIGALDQGTTSTRFMVFDRFGGIVSAARREHEQIYPRPGWVEHDPQEIWRRTCEVIADALAQKGLHGGDLAAVGIANQRETTIVWNRRTGNRDERDRLARWPRLRRGRRVFKNEWYR